MDYENLNWTVWQPMPKPGNCRAINGPKGPGVYQIRHLETKQLIQFGIGKRCQDRMKSLYPKSYGSGTRNNEDKRMYILENWQVLEYRTLETGSREEAYLIESGIKSFKNHLFNT